MESTLQFSLIVFYAFIYFVYYFQRVFYHLRKALVLSYTHKMTNLKPNMESVLLSVFSYVL